MIELERNGTTLKLQLDYYVPYGSGWATTFSTSLSSEHYAQTTYAILRDALEKRFEEVRREAYEQGWKDKSRKKPKQDWFSCQI